MSQMLPATDPLIDSEAHRLVLYVLSRRLLFLPFSSPLLNLGHAGRRFISSSLHPYDIAAALRLLDCNAECASTSKQAIFVPHHVQDDLSAMPRLSIETILALNGLVITVPGAWFAYLQCRSLRQAQRTAQLPSKILYPALCNHLSGHAIAYNSPFFQFGSQTGLQSVIPTNIKPM